MSMDQNKRLQDNGSQNVLWTKINGSRRHTSQISKPCGPEPSSSMHLPNLRKNDITTRRNNVDPEIVLKHRPIQENNSLQPKSSLIVGLSNIKNNTESSLTREEIVLRRKVKVAARKKDKKIEKLQMNDKTVPVVENSGFSLQLAPEDFPTLNELKTKKRINISNHETLSDISKEFTEKCSVVCEPRSSKTLEKSWKPKVNDPIHIDISQALFSKNEKHKLVLKKADPPSQRNILVGNILDSDNPSRKKGKVRPDKVPKPSKLKSHILNERKKRFAEAKENSTLINECSCPEISENKEIKPCNTMTIENENSLIGNCGPTDPPMSNYEKFPSEINHSFMSSVIPANVHSRRFREYCTNSLTEEVISSVCALLEKIAYFQDRMFVREPIKASAKRRYVAGINQVSKYLQVRKVKLLIIAPDLERIPGKGGLDEKVLYLKMEAESQGIPCVFGPNRKRLGKAVKKNTLVSCVAVLSFEGAEEQYSKVLEALHEGKTKYLRLTGYHAENVTTKVEDIDPTVEESYMKVSDVTSSLLAALKEEMLPAERLMNAIQQNDAWAEE